MILEKYTPTLLDEELERCLWKIVKIDEDVPGSGIPAKIVYQYNDYDIYATIYRAHACGEWDCNKWDFSIKTADCYKAELAGSELRLFCGKINEMENDETIKSRTKDLIFSTQTIE